VHCALNKLCNIDRQVKRFQITHFNSSMQSALNQHFNLDPHSKCYPMMLASTCLWTLHSISISILIFIQNVIQWCSFQFRCEVCSQSTFHSFSSCKMLFKDTSFNFSVQSALMQFLNIERYAKYSRNMLISPFLCSLLSSNISILIVMENCIKRCLFQLFCAVCSQSIFQFWSSCKKVIKRCLFQLLCAICSHSTVHSWSSCKAISTDTYFNFLYNFFSSNI
jgi:hypothetical protein